MGGQMFSHNVTLAFYLSSSESSLAGVLVGYAHHGNGEWMQQQRVKLRNNTWELPTKCPKRQLFTTTQPLLSQGYQHSEAANRNCFLSSKTNIILSIIVYQPRSILQVYPCTYFKLLLHYSITNTNKIQLVPAICWFFPFCFFLF